MEVAGSINWTGLGHQVDFSWDKINPRALEDTDCGGGGNIIVVSTCLAISLDLRLQPGS